MGGDCALYGNKGDGKTYTSGNAFDEQTSNELDRPYADWWGDVQPNLRLAPLPSEDETQREIEALLALQQIRPTMMREILNEDPDFIVVFERALGIDAVPRAAKFETRTMLVSLDSVSKFWISRLKKQFDRARPVQRDPKVAPPFCPGHPSYPAAHAGTAHLFEHVLIEATDRHPQYHQGLRDSAKSVSYHREVAGVHYHSDILAGETFAQQFYPALRNDPYYPAAVAKVRAELDPLLSGKLAPRVQQRIDLPK